MNSLLLEKLEELFNDLDNSNEIKEMIELKNKIKENKELSKLLEEYRLLDKYDSKLKDIKIQIINNPLIKRYRELENNLYFTILEANTKLNTLVDKKRCGNESN